jgi:hypothetical protein
VFELVNNGNGSYTPTTLASFNSSLGEAPTGGLISNSAGDLFGTTADGGASGGGTVFELVNNGFGNYTATTLANFSGEASGASPYAGLIADAAGDLFGTTTSGGTDGDGTVFEVPDTNGSYGPIITLVNFDGTNGENSRGSLIADAAGDLFGEAEDGGTSGFGTVFEITGSGFVTSSENVPEPASIALLATGLFGLIFTHRRKRCRALHRNGMGLASQLPPSVFVCPSLAGNQAAA